MQRARRRRLEPETREYAKALEQETLIAEATELVCQLLEKERLTRQDLAERLGKSKGFVTQLLSGDRNMTLRTLSDLAFALNHRFELTPVSLATPRSYRIRDGHAFTAFPSAAVSPDRGDRDPLRDESAESHAAADSHEFALSA